MKNLILVFIIVLSVNSFAQKKYLIFFKDKGILQGSTLLKSTESYQKAVSFLSEKAIERRTRVMGDNELIRFEDLPLREEYITQLENLNIKIHHKLKWFNAVSAYIDDNLLKSIKSLSFIDKVEPVKVFRDKNGVPGKDFGQPVLPKADLDYGPSLGQYALSGVTVLHDLGITGEGIIIGLLDSGFDWKDHESLTGAKVIAEHDFVFNDDVTANQPGDAATQHNHGTFVFSVLGGYKEGRIIGPSYKASFILAKTEDVRTEKHVEEDNYAAALEWMENMGVDITSGSLGYSNGFDTGEGDYTYEDMDGKTTIVTQAAEMAFERGVLVIASAGNEGDKTFHYISAPSDGINVISVGAVTNANSVAAFSSRGPSYDGRIKPDLVAQGVDVYGASSAGFSTYAISNGTSAACPIVSGIAGQMLSAFPYLSNVELRRILIESSDSFSSPDSNKGYGLLAAPLALTYYFPQITSNGLLSKRFFAAKGVKQNSVKLKYTISGETKEVNIPAAANNFFEFEFEDVPQGTLVDLSFTFQDQSGTIFHEPAEGKLYSFKSGENLIVYKTLFTPSDEYTLSNNYPNPFNYDTKTQIRFTAKGGEQAELVIVDGIGQKVKMLFNGIARPGINEVSWDGFTDNDNPCASGVYFYFLKIAGKDFGKKMLLLK